MRADDEGFVGNPKKIIRMVGASDDDYKILVAKRFVLVFESAVMVIKHWLIHNTIRMDRFNPTTYEDEKKMLDVKENKAYTLGGNDMATTGLPTGNQMETQVKLSKVNLIKVNPEKKSHGEFQNVQLSDDEYTKLVGLLNENAVIGLIAELDTYIESTGKKYKSHYATLQNWARRKMQEHHSKVISKGKQIIGL